MRMSQKFTLMVPHILSYSCDESMCAHVESSNAKSALPHARAVLFRVFGINLTCASEGGILERSVGGFQRTSDRAIERSSGRCLKQ